MARSNPKALIIMVHDDAIANSEAMKKFVAKGHIMIREGFSDECDVEIGAKCWRIDPKLKLGDDSTEEESLERQLEMMEKGVRAIKYPKEKPNAKTTKDSAS